MKQKLLSSILLLTCSTLLAQNEKIPHLDKSGTVAQLIVHDKPFLALGGELHNSSTSSASYMRPIWEAMKKKNLNTVIAPVYWEFLEPEQGRFDFSLVDSMLAGARKQKLHLVILWFASWKNGYSTYPPAWIKRDPQKYPRAKDKDGKTLQHLSALGDATAEADARAFRTLMQHIRETDAKEQTVIMAQIENEVGLFGTPRDYSDAANKAFQENVPKDLMEYLISHQSSIQPEIDSAWKANGYKKSGTWEEVFGKGTFDRQHWESLSWLPEELFTVYHYAKYIGKVAAAGKAAYPIPMYVNAWLKQPGFAWPGRYPAGGPIPHTLDVWRAVAPSIDMIEPDIYVKDAIYTVEQYARPGNPVFIPEIRPGLRSANEAFLLFGDYNILGFAPFGIDETSPADDPITKSYAALSQVKDLILAARGKGTMRGIYLDTTQPKQEFELGGYHISAKLGKGGFAQLAGFSVGQKKAEITGGLVFYVGPDEFYVVGKDFSLEFLPAKPSGKSLDVEYLDEGLFDNGKWKMQRRLNGDEGTGGGDYGFGFAKPGTASLRFPASSDGDYKIMHFSIYSY